MYPLNCSILSHHQPLPDDVTPTILPPVSSISFDPWGDFLASAHSDNSLHILRLPFSRYKSASKQISTSSPIVEGGGTKKSELASRPVWSMSRKMIAFQHTIYALTPNMKSAKRIVPVCNDFHLAANATFFAQDRFVLYSSRDELCMETIDANFIQDGDNNDDLGLSPKHVQEPDIFHHYKLGHTPVSIAAINELPSNLLACCCTDKSLKVLDAIHGKELWSRPNAAGDTKSHAIAFPPASENIPLSPDSFNLLVAASTDNGGLCSLWDLRTGRTCSTYRGHTNRTERCMVSFSPCTKYIGVGSEGSCGSAALYDLRMGGKGPTQPKARLGKTNDSSNKSVFRDDTVTDVQFNPLYPQLVTSSLSGRLRWYTESTR